VTRGPVHGRLPGVLRVCYDCVTRVRDSGVGVNGMPPTTMWTRVVRRLGFDHNPLRRASDLVEAWLLPAMIAVFLILSPFVAGTAAAAVRADNAAAQRATQSWHQVPAVLLRAAPGPMMSGNGSNTWLVWTPARWAADGRAHTGDVPAPAGTKAGATVPVWLDRAGDVQVPPPTSAYARDRVMVGMMIALVTLAVLLAGLTLLTRRILHRRRLAGWAAAWLSVGPQWSRHT
jgi:hypothetical protein